jgi:uncharacterized protein YuzE
MRYLLLLCCFAATIELSAQISHRDIVYTSESIELRFPVFSTDDSLVMRKVNAHLSMYILDHLYSPTNSEELKARKPDAVNYYMFGLENEVTAENNAYVSVPLSISSCAARCNGYTLYFNFDTQTGDRLHIQDLIAPTAFDAFKNRMNVLRTNRMANEIAALKKEEDIAAFELEELDEFQTSIFELIETDHCTDYYLKNDSIFFVASYWDEYGNIPNVDLELGLPVQDLSPWLSELGRAVLLQGGNSSLLRAKTLPQLYIGTIGTKTEIVLLAEPMEYPYQRILYAYTKHGGVISWTMEENTLIEQNENGKVADIELQVNSQNLSGTWKSATKILPIAAKRM